MKRIVVYPIGLLLLVVCALIVQRNTPEEEVAASDLVAEPSVVTSGPGVEKSADLPQLPDPVLSSAMSEPTLTETVAQPVLPLAVHPVKREELSTGLSEDPVAVLYAGKPDVEGDLSLWLWGKQKAMDRLVTEAAYRDSHVNILADFFNDALQATAVRDYALQTLAESGTRSLKESDRDQVDLALLKGMQERQSSIAGTAMLGYRRVGERSGAFDSEFLSDQAVQIALDPQASRLSRTTAIQLAAQLGREEIIPVAAAFAGKTRHKALQLASLHALTTLGQDVTPWTTGDCNDCPSL